MACCGNPNQMQSHGQQQSYGVMRPHVARVPVPVSFSAMPDHCHSVGTGVCAPVELNAAYAYQPEDCFPQPLLRGLNSQQIVDGESVFRLYTVYTNAGSDLDCAYTNLQCR